MLQVIAIVIAICIGAFAWGIWTDMTMPRRKK